MLDFIAASPTPFHCAAEAARHLADAGFAALAPADEPQPIEPGGDGYFVRGGTLVAWRAGRKGPAEGGFRVLGAHTDSPNLRVRVEPEQRRDGYVLWGVEVYGGAIVATWADRDLGVSGRVAVRDGDRSRMELVRVDRPVARVPNLAIHLNREVNTKGLKLNKETQLSPVVALAEPASEAGSVPALVAGELGCDAGDVLAWDLCLHDLQPPTTGGLDREFVFSARLDNQACCYAAMQALLAAPDDADATSVVVLFDHEEVGSGSERGAESALLGQVLARLERDHTLRAPGGLERAAARSFMVSADMAHALHPSFADKHPKQPRPRMNGGPVIKSNANMRYATDAGTAARFRLACEAAGVEVQEFVNRADLSCGSTIGPITSASLGIEAVDVGCAMLSMHSIREQCGSRDIDGLSRAMGVILADG